MDPVEVVHCPVAFGGYDKAAAAARLSPVASIFAPVVYSLRSYVIGLLYLSLFQYMSCD
jgi:hypothetical protein